MKTVILLIAIATCGVGHAQVWKKSANTWKLNKRIDKMTDKTVCSLSYESSQYVFYTADDVLVLSYYGRGGVKMYRFRVDNHTASEPVFTGSEDDDNIKIYNRDGAITRASRLRVNGLTVLNGLIDYDVNLQGLTEARNLMATACGLAPLPTAEEANRPIAVPP